MFQAPKDTPSDFFNLQRFLEAQNSDYSAILDELKSGRKRTHWMWFIFPQFAGLGRSEMAVHYAIQSLEEASAYLSHPILGERLRECTSAANQHEGLTAQQIFDSPDDLKFRSCMTLFEIVAEPASVFSAAINKYFAGERDAVTLSLIGR